MMKKTTRTNHISVHSADELAVSAKKRLDIKQIRVFVEELARLPDRAPLPDWSRLSLGDRFAIVLRLIPAGQWQELLGRSTNHIRRYEQGLEIPLTAVAALAAEAEIPIDWIVTGRAQERKPPLVHATPDQQRSDPEDVPLQKLSFRASAGNGALALDESAGFIHFPRAILAHIGVKPQNARLMEAAGDSMRPTIFDGDLILVDVAAADIVEGKIYVFSIGDEVFVKRLRRVGGRVFMLSDNRELFPGEEPVAASLPFRVHGRVKWTGRSL